MNLEELLKDRYVATLLSGALFGIAIFLFRDYGVADSLIITILAFLSSDILSKFFVRGSRNILQIRLFGTQTQPKGYGFIAFFISIFITAIIINIITDMSITLLTESYSNFFHCIAIGVVLAGLVYLDMHERFYAHSKK